MAQRPLSFLTSSWPWRSLAYLSGGVLVGAVAVLVFTLGLAAGLIFLVALIGVAPLVGLVFASTVVATVERRRLRLVDLDHVSDPHRVPEAPGLRGWVSTRLKEQATWRELMFTLLSAVALWWLDLMVLGFSFGLPATTIASTDGDTWPWTVFGVLVLLSTPYTVTSWAGPVPPWPVPSSPRGTGSSARSCVRCAPPSRGFWTPSTPSGSVSSGTSTTEPSSTWCRWV